MNHYLNFITLTNQWRLVCTLRTSKHTQADQFLLRVAKSGFYGFCRSRLFQILCQICPIFRQIFTSALRILEKSKCHNSAEFKFLQIFYRMFSFEYLNYKALNLLLLILLPQVDLCDIGQQAEGGGPIPPLLLLMYLIIEIKIEYVSTAVNVKYQWNIM